MDDREKLQLAPVLVAFLIFANALFFGLNGGTAGGGSSAMSISSNWGVAIGSTGTITSTTKTFTGTGTIRLNVSQYGPHNRTLQYSLNAGTYTTFVDGQTLPVAQTDNSGGGTTLSFRMTGATANDDMYIAVYDNSNSVFIGDCELEHS